MIEVDKTCTYLYFLTQNGLQLIELEVVLEMEARRFARRVTAVRDLAPS